MTGRTDGTCSVRGGTKVMVRSVALARAAERSKFVKKYGLANLRWEPITPEPDGEPRGGTEEKQSDRTSACDWAANPYTYARKHGLIFPFTNEAIMAKTAIREEISKFEGRQL